MAVAKRKPVVEAVPSTPDLGGMILKMRGQIEAYIDAKIAQIKNSRDGRDLPVEVIRQSLTRNDSISDSESGR
jgi:hypothetical protein